MNDNIISSDSKNAMYAPTKGLGFHQFDGNTAVKDILHEIGADFEVRKDSLVRIPEDIMSKIVAGEPVTIPANYIIGSHIATVCKDIDKTIGVVGKDYGVIQNNDALEIVDLLCNSTVNGTPLSVVSAGMVHDFEPYLQCKFPTSGLINGDNSETEFYCFVHTSHDGSSSLKFSFTPIRVICQNTFMMNLTAKNGFIFKHTKNVGQRVDLKDEANIKRVQEFMRKLNLFQTDYIEKMNSFALAKVSDKDIQEYVLNLFLDDEKLKEDARLHNYNYDLTETSTRTKNIISSFMDTLESGVGQDTNRGTKLWVFNGTTNFLSNTASYGSAKDTESARASKRFDSLMEGTANKRMERAMELLAA